MPFKLKSKISASTGDISSTAHPQVADPNIVEDTDDIDENDDAGQSILMGIITQLKPGCDLSRITLPTFILEKKSMLELSLIHI